MKDERAEVLAWAERHLRAVEARVLFDKLEGIDAQLAAGWVPEGRDVTDVVSDLRSRLGRTLGEPMNP